MKEILKQLYTSRNGTAKERLVRELKRIGRRKDIWRFDPLLFCHIPKCAGTSIRKIIKSEYKHHQRLFLYIPDPKLFVDKLDLASPNQEFIAHFATIRKNLQIIYGHFAFGIHHVLNVSPCYATVIRHPVSRIASLHHHLARSPEKPLFQRIQSGLSLKEFVAMRVSPQTSNHMTRMLAGVSQKTVEDWSDNAILQQAKENIKRFFCSVATTDDMTPMLITLGKKIWMAKSFNSDAECNAEQK